MRTESARQVKSTERVRDLGEVFTPADTVRAMLDLLPEEVWAVHPSYTFLEPACGDGNFLAAILERKLRRIGHDADAGRLPAVCGKRAEAFHALEAVASLYAMDISPDNVVGGTPGHEIGARGRMIDVLQGWWRGRHGGENSQLLRCAQWIVERNIQVANMLEVDGNGNPTKRDGIPLVEYAWEPTERMVSVARTTLGQVEAASQAEMTGTLTLFDVVEPIPVWSGVAEQIFEAEVPAPKSGKGTVRNGRRR